MVDTEACLRLSRTVVSSTPRASAWVACVCLLYRARHSRHYLPFLTMSGSSLTTACFQEIREAGGRHSLGSSQQPQAGMRPQRTVKLRSFTSDHSMRYLRYFARHLRSVRGVSAVLSQFIAFPRREGSGRLNSLYTRKTMSGDRTCFGTTRPANSRHPC